MSNRYFSTIVLSAFIIAGVFACKKDDPKTPPSKECKDKPTGTPFSDVPNLDFEDWYSGTSAGANKQQYYNPSPSCFWATPNNGSGDLGLAKIPVPVFRVGGDSAYSGNYALMLKTGEGELLGKKTLIAGTVASGNFQIDINNPLQSLKFGKPFNKKPKTVTGYYRYFPVGGDSASAYCYVTKNLGGDKLDTIGIGRKIFYDQQNEYAQFSFDVIYKNEETHDNLVIYFASSEAGADFKGQVGNTLFIDEVTVGY
jgi:hypothetical protein